MTEGLQKPKNDKTSTSATAGKTEAEQGRQTKELFQTAGEAAMSAMVKTVQTHHIIYA